MEVAAELENLERERLDILELATRIVEWAGWECRPVTGQEDARRLEAKIERLKRHRNIKGQEQRK